MEYEHLFAESDIEEADSQNRVDSFTNQPAQHSTASNNLVFSSYRSPSAPIADPRYWRGVRINNCNMCRTRSRRDQVTQPLDNLCDERACAHYRRKRILYDRELPTKHKAKKNEPHKLDNSNQQVNNLSVAGPSRLIDTPVDYRYLNFYLITVDYPSYVSPLNRHSPSPNNFFHLNILKSLVPDISL